MTFVSYDITGRVYFRCSTNEWVLEVEGEINDTHFTCKHTEPSTTKPEDVAGLPSLYEALEQRDALAAKVERLREALEEAANSLDWADQHLEAAGVVSVSVRTATETSRAALSSFNNPEGEQK